MTRLKGFGAVTLLVCWVLSGCAQAEKPNAAPGPQSEREELLAEAKEGGASPEQLKVLADAGPSGVAFAPYERAVTKALQCMRDAGIDVINDKVTTSEGSPAIDYDYSVDGVGSSEEEGGKIADDCLRRHSQYVEFSYQSSTPVVKARNNYMSKYLPAAVACLKGHGMDVPDGATWGEIEILDHEWVLRGLDSAEDPNSVMPCVVKAQGG